MARASSARSTSNGDIPFARRSGSRRGLRGLGSRRLFLIVLFLASLGLVAIFRSGFFVGSMVKPPPGIGEGQSELEDGLLGHLAYPEASLDELVTIYPGLQVHKDTADAYQAMRAAAIGAGIELALLSGYRSHDLQRQIFFEIKSERNQTASERAKVSAPPGYSEHSTGYAIDLGDRTRPDTHFKTEFESTPAFNWLKKNAARYHFILSFPKNNAQGVTYEPWHWRFEGTAEALREFDKARRSFSY